MSKPKVVVIGAGSYFFGKPIVWNMARSPVLREGTLAFVDTKPDVLDTMMQLARRVFDHEGVSTGLIGSTDRREVLKDADFVVLTFSDRNTHFRGLDCEIAMKHGVRMCSGDTIGPGGIFRALREIPHAVKMAEDVQELAPNAWVINFVNPTSVIGIALMRYTKARSFAICDGQHEPYCRLSDLKRVGILPEEAKSIPSEVEDKLDLRISGINHFTWLTRFVHDGKDMMPAYRKWLVDRVERERADAEQSDAGARADANASAKRRFNAEYSLQLMDIFGAYPNRIAHTKEYVPYFQGYGAAEVDPEPIVLFDAGERQRAMDERWAQTVAYAKGDTPIGEFMDKGMSDHATDIIESMWGGLGKPFYVNTANRGAVSNMADNAFLELRCHIDLQGPVPIPVGEIPAGLCGLQQQVLDTHELTAEAAVKCDRNILLKALVTDPIVNNISDARAIMEESLEREKDALPEDWNRD